MISFLLLAQLAQPVQKIGQCPMNYITNGNYCVPLRRATNAVPQDGQCPLNYYTSGSYCRRYSN